MRFARMVLGNVATVLLVAACLQTADVTVRSEAVESAQWHCVEDSGIGSSPGGCRVYVGVSLAFHPENRRR